VPKAGQSVSCCQIPFSIAGFGVLFIAFHFRVVAAFAIVNDTMFSENWEELEAELGCSLLASSRKL
jgi:hypothetical protein